MSQWTYRTDWGNIGLWVDTFRPDFGIKTPWGNVIIKKWSSRLFSERYGYQKAHFRLFGLCVSWVRLRQYHDLSEAIAHIEPPDTPLMQHLRKRANPAPHGKGE